MNMSMITIMSKMYPICRPFKAKMNSTCEWSGLPIYEGDTLRFIASNYSAGVFADKTLVLERFLRFACQDIWTRARQVPPTILDDYPDEIVLVMRDGTVRTYTRKSDGKWRKNNSWHHTKDHNFKRALSACVAYRYVVNNAERQSQEVANG
jgi:hypothetical protein